VNQLEIDSKDAEIALGASHPLVDQLGSSEGLVALEAATALLQVQKVKDYNSLSEFLDAYQKHLLVPIELPAIVKAFHMAENNQLKELFGLDQKLRREELLESFSPASFRVGRWQLQRLRPLRDVRFVQRFLRAVDSGEARAWHTLVYGLTLSLFSIPLRQGLVHYSNQVHQGFIHCAGFHVKLTVADSRKLLSELEPSVDRSIQKLLPEKAEELFKVC
jgi:urease accessory protein UreF